MKIALLATCLLLASVTACQRAAESPAGTPSTAAPAPAPTQTIAVDPNAPAPTKITKNVVAAIEYTLTDSEGKVLDTSKGREPLSYLQGYGNIVVGLEKALEGKARGESLKVTIPPEEGYGVRSEDLVKTLPKSQFQADEIKPGMQFGAPGGGSIKVTKVEGDKVTVDANHPLAGMALTFDVTVKDLRNATAEELTHGHFHGAGGH